MSLGQVVCRFFKPQSAAGQISKIVEVNLNNFFAILYYVGDVSTRVTVSVGIVGAVASSGRPAVFSII